MASTQDVTIESGRRALAARVFVPDEDQASGRGLLFVHGRGSGQDGYRARAEAASRTLGAVCLTFDLSGHGRSDGRLEELRPRDHLDDALAAYDELTDHDHVDRTRVGVCGASYGGYLATLLIARRPVERLLLRAPALYDDGYFDLPFGQRRGSRHDTHAPAVLGELTRFAGPVLVVESGKDEVIGHEIISAYLDACRQAHHEVIPDADHGLTEPSWEEAFVRAVLAWFAEL